MQVNFITNVWNVCYKIQCTHNTEMLKYERLYETSAQIYITFRIQGVQSFPSVKI